MSMIGNFFRTDEKTVQKIQAGKLSLIDLIYNRSSEIDKNCILSIDKAWHAIHFILSGKVWDCTEDPLSKMILSGNIINDEDIGYGPAMLITTEEVHNINNALKTVSEDWFRKRFSVSDMLANSIYSVSYNEDEELFNYIYSLFRHAVAFFKDAEINNQCILFFIN